MQLWCMTCPKYFSSTGLTIPDSVDMHQKAVADSVHQQQQALAGGHQCQPLWEWPNEFRSCNFFVCTAKYALKILINFFPLPSSEPTFMRLILHMSTGHFVRQCFDTVGWAM